MIVCVFGWFFFCVELVDVEEIMEGFDFSCGVVSMVCKELCEWGLVF